MTEAEIVPFRMEWKTGEQGRMNRPWTLIICWGRVGWEKGECSLRLRPEKMIAPEIMSSRFSYAAFHEPFGSSTWGAWFKVICTKEM